MDAIQERREALRRIGKELRLRTKEQNQLDQLTSLGTNDLSPAEAYLLELVTLSLIAEKISADTAAEYRAIIGMPVAA